MSFDQLSNLESQSSSRRGGDDSYTDDPEFQRLSQDLQDKQFMLTGNISRLSTQISHLGTRRDNERMRERLHELLEETTQSFKEVGEGVKQIQQWEDVSPSQRYTQQKLSRDLKSLLQQFQSVQQRALEKQRASAAAARSAFDDTHGFSGGDDALGGHQTQLQAQEQVRLADQAEVDFQDAMIREREEEIRGIEQGVSELNELFRDVATIVSQQGETLNILSDNVQNVRADTRGADVELRTAARYQKNARTKACCLLLILAVILTIILLAVFLG